MQHSQQIIIGNYHFTMNNLLGKGSTGNVYSGYRITDHKSVAIKVIHLKQNQTEVTKNLLESQKKSLKKLSGKQNIIQLLDLIQNDQFCYIITEIYTGGTLKDYINRKGKLPQQQALQIFKKILTGYTAISQCLIIHRDLKPANIMLHGDKLNQPVIIDFGYSEIIQTSTVMKAYNVGSPSYMAPEAYSKTLYSQKSDIWALGVIFYEMLTGKTLDEGSNIKVFFESLTSEFIFRKLVQFSSVSHELLSQVLKIAPHERISAHKMKYILDKNMIERIQRNNQTLTLNHNIKSSKIFNSNPYQGLKSSFHQNKLTVNRTNFNFNSQVVQIKNKTSTVTVNQNQSSTVSLNDSKFQFKSRLVQSRYRTVQPHLVISSDVSKNDGSQASKQYYSHYSQIPAQAIIYKPDCHLKIDNLSSKPSFNFNFSAKNEQHYQYNTRTNYNFNIQNNNLQNSGIKSQIHQPLVMITKSRQNYQTTNQLIQKSKHHPIHHNFSTSILTPTTNINFNQINQNQIRLFKKDKTQNYHQLYQNQSNVMNLNEKNQYYNFNQQNKISGSKQSKFSFKKDNLTEKYKPFTPINYHSTQNDKQNNFIMMTKTTFTPSCNIKIQAKNKTPHMRQMSHLSNTPLLVINNHQRNTIQHQQHYPKPQSVLIRM